MIRRGGPSGCILCAATDPKALGGRLDGYLRCPRCDLYFLDPPRRLTPAAERARYELHRASVEDQGYLTFVRPLLEAVRARLSPPARGLDFGAGRVPVLAHHLKELGYEMTTFDPFFDPNPPWGSTYDFVVCCEVIEHLYHPAQELAKIRAGLRPGGLFAVMTNVRSESTDFASWTYRRDPTHVGFYSRRTFRWIENHFGFKIAHVDQRLICLKTPEVE